MIIENNQGVQGLCLEARGGRQVGRYAGRRGKKEKGAEDVGWGTVDGEAGVFWMNVRMD